MFGSGSNGVINSVAETQCTNPSHDNLTDLERLLARAGASDTLTEPASKIAPVPDIVGATIIVDHHNSCGIGSLHLSRVSKGKVRKGAFLRLTFQ